MSHVFHVSLNREAHLCVYICIAICYTGNLCIQGIREFTAIFREFLKSINRPGNL